MAVGKYYIAPFRWSKTVWIISIVTTIVIIGTSFIHLFIPDIVQGYERYIIMCLLLPLPVICFCLAPRYLCLINGMLIVKRWVGKKSIPVRDIVSIEEVDRWSVMRSTRTMGNGGLFGYYGHYHNRQFGKFRMFATETSHLYLLCTAKEKYVISCQNKELIAALQEQIKR